MREVPINSSYKLKSLAFGMFVANLSQEITAGSFSAHNKALVKDTTVSAGSIPVNL